MPYRQAANEILQLKTTAGLTWLGVMLSWDSTTAFIGVPLNVLLAGLTGALLGIAYGEPIRPRRRLVVTTLVNAFLSAGISALLPHLPMLGWLGHAPAAALALVLGFAFRWAVPAAVERLPELIRGLAAKLGARESPRGKDP